MAAPAERGHGIWRAQERWTERGPDGETDIAESVADGAKAYETIWAFLLGLGLARTVRLSYAAVDEPLHYLVGDRADWAASSSTA